MRTHEKWHKKNVSTVHYQPFVIKLVYIGVALWRAIHRQALARQTKTAFIRHASWHYPFHLALPCKVRSVWFWRENYQWWRSEARNAKIKRAPFPCLVQPQARVSQHFRMNIGLISYLRKFSSTPVMWNRSSPYVEDEHHIIGWSYSKIYIISHEIIPNVEIPKDQIYKKLKSWKLLDLKVLNSVRLKS